MATAESVHTLHIPLPNQKSQLQWTELIHAYGSLSQVPVFLPEDFLWPQEHGCQPIHMAK